jgi:catechol 2,3-dioxygenase-like lactoylglutathione lyase family enzyme
MWRIMFAMLDRAHNLTAILPCSNVSRSKAFYERLGFQVHAGDDHYLMMRDGKGGELHLQPACEGWLIPGRNSFGLYLFSEDVDALAAKFLGEILGKIHGPEDKPWGMYEFALSDPDETLVRIGWPTRLRAPSTKQD